MVYHQQISSYEPVNKKDDLLTRINIRKLINSSLAPNFIMEHIEIEPSGVISNLILSKQNEIFILEGDFKAKINSQEMRIIRDDFLYFPPNTKISLQKDSTNVIQLLRVYPKMTFDNAYLDIIHTAQEKIKKVDVTAFNSKNTTIQIFVKAEKNFEFIMRRFELKSGAKIGLHDHVWEHEMFLVEGNMDLVDKNGNLEHINSNEFIFMPPNEPHGYLNKGNSPAIFICMIPNIKN
jgi:quercetin dioxygenase-like cupin family protein